VAGHDDVPQSHKCLVDIGTVFGSHPKPSELGEAVNGSLDDPRSSPQVAAMLGVSPPGDCFDAPLLEHGSMTLVLVDSVALNSRWPAARSSRLTTRSRYRIHSREYLRNVVFVEASPRVGERNAVRVGREVALAPLLPTICGTAALFCRPRPSTDGGRVDANS